MTRITLQLVAWSAVLALASGVTGSARAADLVVTGCVVEPDDDVKLSADEAGKLVELSVEEGSQVRAGDQIAKVDDRQPRVQEEAAKYALAAAIKRAKDDVEIRYSQAAAKVAEAEYDKILESNRQSENSVTEVEVLRAKLEWDKDLLSIVKSQHDQELAKYDAYTKQAELAAATLAIDRRIIRAPFDGEVVTVFVDQDEWVNPGDPILRVVRLDTLLVEGFVDQGRYDPHEIQNCEVTVEVTLARGRREQFPGRIKYVSSLVMANGAYLVRAEVANRQEFGRWMLRDGLTATMAVHLGTGGAAPVGLSRRP
jgi:multidrug efflux pump subunit AcrA (membrane-fusion protein)